MRSVMAQLWEEDGGAVLTTEWVLLVLVLIFGVAIGFFAVRQAILMKVLDLTNHPPGEAASAAAAGSIDSEIRTDLAPKPKDPGDPLVVKSTAAVPGGIDSRSCD